jgi:hypothetical protein
MFRVSRKARAVNGTAARDAAGDSQRAAAADRICSAARTWKRSASLRPRRMLVPQMSHGETLYSRRVCHPGLLNHINY